ncbi:MAG TPA: hypothetical protein VHT72_05570, partial [Puia sp.]|nr:hypothetical protein [Puia sp.]
VLLHNALVAVLFALACLYLTISFGCAFSVAKREGWKFLAVMPVVFATYQLPYALGFLLGLFHHLTASSPANRPQKVFAATTR